MNEREIAEIRRRFRAEKSNISRIRGCYVNDKKEITSQFNQSLGLMSPEEAEELLAILKKTLSGTIGKNLTDISFSTQQVSEGEEHKLLTKLRKTELEDDEAVAELFGKIIQALDFEGNYLILLACDKYDIPTYSKDGEKSENTAGVFSYFLCSVCPVKLSKSALGYYAYENKFRNLPGDWVVFAPELGFMFPAYDNRAANIYNSLYYSRNTSENHKEFVEAVFNSEVPMPAAAQKETFCTILSDTISEDCSYQVVQSVHGRICDMIEEHKLNKEEPQLISKNTVTEVLKSCGVSEERVSAFSERYDDEFGIQTELSPQNIMEPKHFEVSTPDVTIKVNPDRSDLVETRTIDGVKYIMVRVSEGVEVNGVNIHITD